MFETTGVVTCPANQNTLFDLIIGGGSFTAGGAVDYKNPSSDLINLINISTNNRLVEQPIPTKIILKDVHCDFYITVQGTDKGPIILDMYRYYCYKQTTTKAKNIYEGDLFATPHLALPAGSTGVTITQIKETDFATTPFDSTALGKYFKIYNARRVILDNGNADATTWSIKSSRLRVINTTDLGTGEGALYTGYMGVRNVTQGYLIFARNMNATAFTLNVKTARYYRWYKPEVAEKTNSKITIAA